MAIAAPGLSSLLRALLRRFVRFTTVPPDGGAPRLDRSHPVVYALQVRQLSALLVLEEATERLGLPSPRAPLADAGLAERGAYFFLTPRGQPSPLVRAPYRYAPRLARLIAALPADPAFDPQIVPVTVFWGRAPQKQASILAALFADAWAVPGIIGQLARILIHGRQTLVVFGEPLSLRAAVSGLAPDAHGPDAALRRVGRLLREAFRLERERAIGPNLSHRSTLLNAVIAAEPVRAAIADEARLRGEPAERTELRARRIATGIASHYSYPFIRAFDIGLTALWNRLYDGLAVHHFDDVVRAAGGAGLVYVPCHRSHVDYLLLSYLVYHRGLPPPHVAAGDNLNLPVVGSLLRRGGAFFLRRSFKGDALYGAVFAEYLHQMLSRGFPIEYFIEGGRSRTGYLLPPKAGMLTMTVDSALRDPVRPLVFVPVYIGYERLVEGDTYVAELSGQPKQRETVLGLVSTLRSLRGRFGQVHVSFGEPLPLAAAEFDDTDTRFDAVGRLATRLARRINDAVVINAMNLLACAMLAAPRPAIDARQLAQTLDVLRDLLVTVPYSPRQVVSCADGAAVLEQAERQGIVQRVRHPLGDVITTDRRQALLLGYFRNNVLHALALPSLAATLVARNERIDDARLLAVATRLYPFLQAGLFLSEEPAALPARLSQLTTRFVALGLARRDTGGGLAGPPATDPRSRVLHGLARLLRAPLERFFIVVRTVLAAPAGSLDARVLEDRCLLCAQRVVMLHESVGPEFADRAAFRTVIETLVALEFVHDLDERLHPAPRLADVVDDARWLLSADTQLALSHLTDAPLPA